MLRSLYPVPLFLSAGLLQLFPLLKDPRQVLFWRGGAFSDLLVSHWPNAVVVRRSIETWGQLPLWNPSVLSGAPLAADPLAGLWYPPSWLAIALPTALGFNLLIWLHLAWAGIGCWALARRLGQGHAGAIVSGLAFNAAPKLIGHVGLGHVSLVFAVSWTPWVLLAVEAAARASRGSVGHRLSRAASAGALSGLVLLADPRWYPGLILLGAAFFLWRAAHSHDDSKGEAAVRTAEPSGARAAASGPNWARLTGMLSIGGAVSLAVGSALLAPLTEFVALSTRSGLELSQSAAASLPPARTVELLAPDLGVWPEWQAYSGAVVLFLACLSVLQSWRTGRFWLGVLAIGLLVAVGDATPFYPIARVLIPGLSQLRVPPRSLLLVGFGLAMLAGQGFDALNGLSRRTIGRAAGLLLALYLLLGAVNWIASSGQPAQERLIEVIPWGISGIFVAIAGAWTGVGIRKRLSAGSFATFLAAVLLMDLTLVNLTTLKAEAVAVDPLVERVAEHTPDGQRIFSPSYSVTQPGAAMLGLENADGVNPLQLRRYRDFMAQATGFEAAGYSVTLPPFPSGAVDQPWGFEPDLEQLGSLAVSTIVSDYALTSSGLELLEHTGGRYIYRNPAALPRAWIVSGDLRNQVRQLEWSPNRIELQAAGPGRLVLSEVDYPGWRASIDGVDTPIELHAGLLRSVDLPAGPHQVVFSFRPTAVYAGAMISLIGLLFTLSLWLRR